MPANTAAKASAQTAAALALSPDALLPGGGGSVGGTWAAAVGSGVLLEIDRLDKVGVGANGAGMILVGGASGDGILAVGPVIIGISGEGMLGGGTPGGGIGLPGGGMSGIGTGGITAGGGGGIGGTP
jgi:hypothetical protein